MLRSLFSSFFGCSHQRTTFPLTLTNISRTAGDTPPSRRKRTYVVCLDCGGEFEYNWRDMRVNATVPQAEKRKLPHFHTPGDASLPNTR